MKKGLVDATLSLLQQAQKPIWLPFVGTSMFPQIKEGDVILVQHALGSIRFGDVIVFKRREGLIAHRVVSIKRDGNRRIYQTKGDNRYAFDAPIPQASILGRVICVQRKCRLIRFEKQHIRLFSIGFALFSAAIGILYQAVKRVRLEKDYEKNIYRKVS